MHPGARNFLPTPTRSINLKHLPTISGPRGGSRSGPLNRADIVAVERALAQAEAFGDASEKITRSRPIAFIKIEATLSL